jgi:hypothetical protein
MTAEGKSIAPKGRSYKSQLSVGHCPGKRKKRRPTWPHRSIFGVIQS